jgi:hypothetical protein
MRQTAPAASQPIISNGFPSFASSDQCPYTLSRIYSPSNWEQEHLMPELLAYPRFSNLAAAQLGTRLRFPEIGMSSMFHRLTKALQTDNLATTWQQAQQASLAVLCDIEILENNI